MAGPARHRHLLYVEGPDDEHAIGHLLIQRGVDPRALPDFKDVGGKQGLLQAIPVAVRAGTGKSLAFVIDANDDPRSTWESIASRLERVGIEAPDEIPEGGFAGKSVDYCARVGVWLMPDNRKTGALEDFLRDLIDQSDPLLCLAEHSAEKAKQLGAKYSDRDAQKAVLHTWLAWQKDPGRPYGVAIKARFFGVDSAAMDEFVSWFQRVFGVTAQPPAGTSRGRVQARPVRNRPGPGTWGVDSIDRYGTIGGSQGP
ncbi:MAG: hypothetical protein OXN89_01810, partial [Bryobacterales bacterium]|nr:hypothetical protein [Bryobacterales bacterium]